MLKVLHLHSRLSARGGAHRHLSAVLDRLQGRAQTLLAVGHDDGSLGPGSRRTLGPWVRVKGLDRNGLSAKGGRAARRRLQEIVRDFGPQVIHIHNIMDPELIRTASSLVPGLMTVQDHRAFCPGLGKLTPWGTLCSQALGRACAPCFGNSGYAARLLELTQQRLSAMGSLRTLLVLSAYMARELKQAFAALGLPLPGIEVLPPTVQGLAPAAQPGGGGYHLLAGRLVARKGVLEALRAAKLLKHPLPLVVAGEGPLAGRVGQAAAESRGRIRYEGWARRDKMASLLADACSLWLPSLWAEPFGIVGLEALSQGTPVIASQVGGIGEWLTAAEAGIIVPPGDFRALARAADRLGADPGLARDMGGKGAAWVKASLTPGPLMDRLLAVYQDTAGRRNLCEEERV